MRWMGQVAHKGDRRGAYMVLVGKPEGRDHFEDPGIGKSIKKNLQEMGGGMDSIDLDQNRDRWWALLNTVMNLQVS
jgi:hypothetical protein